MAGLLVDVFDLTFLTLPRDGIQYFDLIAFAVEVVYAYVEDVVIDVLSLTPHGHKLLFLLAFRHDLDIERLAYLMLAPLSGKHVFERGVEVLDKLVHEIQELGMLFTAKPRVNVVRDGVPVDGQGGIKSQVIQVEDLGK